MFACNKTHKSFNAKLDETSTYLPQNMWRSLRPTHPWGPPPQNIEEDRTCSPRISTRGLCTPPSPGHSPPPHLLLTYNPPPLFQRMWSKTDFTSQRIQVNGGYVCEWVWEERSDRKGSRKVFPSPLGHVAWQVERVGHIYVRPPPPPPSTQCFHCVGS